MKIKHKLLIIMISMILVVASIIGLLSSYILKKHLEEQVVSRLNESSKKTASSIFEFIHYRQDIVKRIAQNESIKLLFSENGHGVLEVQDVFSIFGGFLDEISLMDNEGNEVVKFFDGIVSVRLKENLKNDCFVKTLSDGNYEKLLYENGILKGIVFGERVYNTFEEPAGVLKGVIYVSKITEYIKSLELSEDVGSYVIDYKGIPFGIKEKEFKNKKLLSNKNFKIITDHMANEENELPKIFYTEINGQKQMVSVFHMPHHDWFVIKSLPVSFFSKAVKILNTLILILTTVVVLIGSGAAAFIAGKFSEKILLLIKATEAFTKGNLSQRVNIDSKDEIRLLGDSFNTMAEDIQDLITLRNKEIEDRTIAEEKLKLHLKKEEMINAIVVWAIASKKLDDFLEVSLKILGEGLGVSRVYFFEHNNEKDTMSNTFEWVGKGVKSQKDNLQDISSSEVPWFIEKMLRDEVINVYDIEEISDENVKNMLKSQDIKSTLNIPVYIKDDYFGFLGFDECTKNKKWEDSDIDILHSVAYVISVVIESKISEENLTKSEEKYRAIFNTSKDALMTLSLEKGFLSGNDSAVKIFMCKDEEEFVSKAPPDLSPEYQPDGSLSMVKANEMMSLAMEKGANFFEWKHKRLNGEEFDATVLLTKINLEGKEALQATVRDITEQKEAESNLRLAKEKLDKEVIERRKSEEIAKYAYTELDQIFNSTTDAMLVMDSDLEILRANKMLLSLFGKKEDEIMGKKCFEVFHTEYCHTKDCCLNLVKSDMKKIERELIISIGKTKYIFMETAVPFLSINGELMGIIINYRDITEKKKMEEELLKEKKIESVGLLAGGIAHNFNNLLTMINGNIEMFAMSMQEGDNNYKYIKASLDAVKNARELSNQLLTFSTSGTPVREIVSVGDFLRQAVLFNLHGSIIKPQFSIDKDLFNVEIDTDQIKQVINNILINAKEVMPEGGNLFVDASNFEVNEDSNILEFLKGSYVKISIKDEGPGMDKEIINDIFTPFYSTKGEGRGLGLSIGHSILKKHSGHINAELVDTKGTRFNVFLPATSSKVKETISRKRKTGSINSKISSKVLIMDDEQGITDMLGDFLKKAGCTVETAPDGDKAIEKYKKAKEKGIPFDMVFLDITIPGGMGGENTIKELKKYDPEIYAVVMSGYSKDPVLSNYSDHGFKKMIKKPFDLEDILEIIERVKN
ncbi:MAG: PAS domain S-box protein [Candidatus Aureabacteria bacterium]|nr:PAS domain S-box protein [Candidatus Auribacterota bacterium]